MAIFLEGPLNLATYGLELPVRRLMQRSLSILILWRCIRAVLEKGFITLFFLNMAWMQEPRTNTD
jgi:hypothetical protein